MMQIFRHYHDIPEECRGAVVAMGNFDGFHRGHQAVIAEAGDLADRLGAPLAVLTTEPHPRNFFAPDAAPFRLTPFHARARLLSDFGVDVLVVLNFNQALARMPAEQFVLDVLVGGLGVCHVVAGYNYRFGRGRGGGIDVLRWMGGMEGFGVSVMQPVLQPRLQVMGGSPYSSSSIRQALEAGEPGKAARLLGHWWSVEGQVLHGDRRGRTIGFPTLNLSMEEYLKPRPGVYAVRVALGKGAAGRIVDGVANIGQRPTFEKQDVILEAHLFDFSDDLYGAHVAVEIVDFIRAEAKFDGLESLKAQIARDCVNARAILARPENEREPLLLKPLHLGANSNWF